MTHILTIAGNRPQFVKVGALYSALLDSGIARHTLVNTGQHYDWNMSETFFEQLKIPDAQYNLGVGSGQPLDQIGKMLPDLRWILEDETPDVVLVMGDTNSTLAGALAAAHTSIKCVHVEAGERIFRRNEVPEEVNRVASDTLSGLLLTCTRKSYIYLINEGVCPDRVAFVGDPMLDLFKLSYSKAEDISERVLRENALTAEHFRLCTIHRVENTTDAQTLTRLLETIDRSPVPVVLPAHPRISKILREAGWQPRGSLKLIEPLESGRE